MSLSIRKGTINTAQPKPPVIATATADAPPLIGVGNHFRRSATPPGCRHEEGTLHSCWGECQKIPSAAITSFDPKLVIESQKRENTQKVEDGDS